MCGRVSVRNEGISGRLTRLDLQDRVAARPVEALQDNNVRLVSVRCPEPQGKRSCMKELIRDPAPAVARSSRMTILFLSNRAPTHVTVFQMRADPEEGTTEYTHIVTGY
jgi:hypothetical protein